VPGTLNAADVTFGIGTNFNPVLAGSSNSLLFSTGSVNLAGSNLSLSLPGFVPNAGPYIIISARGSINGTFNGLPDGSLVTVGEHQFLIRYLNRISSGLGLGSSQLLQQVQLFPVPASTTTILFASPNPVVAGQEETLTVIVTSPAAAAAGFGPAGITGSVSFFDMGKMLKSKDVGGGTAVYRTSFDAGNHTITATYDSSQFFTTSNTNQNPLNLVVIPQTVGWHNVLTGNFSGHKMADIAGMTASGQWWVAVSNGSSFANQFWGSWDRRLQRRRQDRHHRPKLADRRVERGHLDRLVVHDQRVDDLESGGHLGGREGGRFQRRRQVGHHRALAASRPVVDIDLQWLEFHDQSVGNLERGGHLGRCQSRRLQRRCQSRHRRPRHGHYGSVAGRWLVVDGHLQRLRLHH
jgi:hypothetical protein